MSDQDPTTDIDDDLPEVPPPTPFDHPMVVPILCLGFTIYFGYDGWFNPEIESIQFNRWGFGVLLLLTLWFGYGGLKEMRAASAQSEDTGETQG